MIVANHLILPQIRENEDLSWNNEIRRQMTKDLSSLASTNQRILHRSTKKFQHE